MVFYNIILKSSQDLRSGQVDVEAHVFYSVINILSKKIALSGF